MLLGGAAFDQIVAMYNWYQRISSNVGQAVPQFGIERIARGAAVPATHALIEADSGGGGNYLYRKPDAIATGELHARLAADPDRKVTVTGSSLGGHLAMAFAALFPTQTSQAFAFNSPGFANFETVNRFFQILGGARPTVGHPLITNAVSTEANNAGKALDLIAGWWGFPGKKLEIPIENQFGSDVENPKRGSWNHDQRQVTDALALFELLQSLVPSLTLADFYSLKGAAAAGETRSFENLLDGIEQLLGINSAPLPAGNTEDARSRLHASMQAIEGNALFKSLTGQVNLVARHDAKVAMADFAAHLSLSLGLPFSIRLANTAPTSPATLSLSQQHGKHYEQWLSDLNLPDEQRNVGLAHFSSDYLRDRATWGNAVFAKNQRNEPGTAASYRDGLDPVSSYQDLATGVIASSAALGTPNVARIVFGGAGIDSISGAATADRLYGGAGNDVLTGLDGADRLEGNDGADQLSGGPGADTLLGGADNDTLDGGDDNDLLKGGNGSDTYRFAAAWKHDVIEDADGLGAITVDGIGTLNGAGTVKAGDNVWQTPDKRINYTLVTVDPTRNDLYITFSDRTDVITVRGWTPQKNLGINGLSMGTAAPPPPPAASYAGDFSKKQNGPFYEITSRNYVGDGPQAGARDVITGSLLSDRLQGFMGNDALAGLDGDDWIDGGADDDLLLGGLGRDTLEGGAGRDFLFGAGTGGLNYPERADAPPIAALTDQEYTRGFSWVTSERSSFTYSSAGPSAIVYRDHWVTGVNALPVANDAGNVLDGGAGDDRIYGGADADFARGGNDHDALDGLGGRDTLFGDDGNDLLSGDGTPSPGFINSTPWEQHGGDLLDGGRGHDLIYGDGGDDTLVGGEGNDTLEGGRHQDELIGGSGDDLLLGDRRAGWVVSEHLGNDTLDGGEGNDTLEGGGRDDRLLGGVGNDMLLGDARDEGMLLADNGADVLDGQAGDDLLVGGGRGDTLIGGAGHDQLQGDGSRITLADGGDDLLDGGDGDDLLFGDGGNDLLRGGSGRDELTGDVGNDTLDGGTGVDVLDGGAGDDTYLIRISELEAIEFVRESPALTVTRGLVDGIEDTEGNNTVVIDAHAASDLALLSRNPSGDTALSFRNNTALIITQKSVGRIGRFEFLDGTLSAAQLIGRAPGAHGVYFGQSPDGAAVLYGDAKDNYAYNGTGSATLSGGRGNDSLLSDGGNNRYLYDRGDGIDRVEERSTQARPAGGSRIAFGAGIGLADVTMHMAGAELVVQIGNDGSDAIRLAMGDPSDPALRPAVERLDFADGSTIDLVARYRAGFTVAGSDGADHLWGSTGADRIDGGNGKDTLTGGAGSDTYGWGMGQGDDRIDDRGPTTDSDRVQLTNTLSPANLLLLRRGDDLVLHSRAGLDQLSIEGQFSGQGIEQIVFSDGTAWSRADILARVSTDGTEAADAFTGNDGNDTLRGFGGNDTLDGAAGNDLLDGGAGDDVLRGGAGNDTLRSGAAMAGGEGSDRYELVDWPSTNQVTFIREGVSASVDNDVVVLPSSETLATLAFGRDTSNGDLVITGDTGGRLRLMGYFDDDPVRSGIEELRLASGQVLRRADIIERLEYLHRLTPTAGDDVIIGLRFDDAIDGAAGNDTVNGGQGNDVLNGGLDDDLLLGSEGNDTLHGGTGVDLLTGGNGNDSYRFGRASGREVIDQGRSAGPTGDRILMDADVNPADVRLIREDQHLALVIAGSTAKLTVDGWFQTTSTGEPLNALQSIVFANGTVWLDSDIRARVQTPAVTVSTTPQGIDTVTVGASARLGADQEHLTSTASFGVRLHGNALDNRITGGTGDDILNGPDVTDVRTWDGSLLWTDRLDPTKASDAAFSVQHRGGADTLIGGLGNDVYFTTSTNGESSRVNQESDIAASNDTVVELPDQGIDTIVTTAHHDTLPAHVEHLISFNRQNFSTAGLHSSEPIAHRYTGNALDNRLDARAVGGTVRLDGGAGADVMIGGPNAANIYVVDHVGDQAIEAERVESTVDTVESSIDYTLPEAIEALVLTGGNAIRGNGNARHNQLDGSLNAAGNVLTGGAGDDTYRVGAGDTVVERAGEGADTVIITQPGGGSFSLGQFANVETLVLDKLAGAASLTGTTGNDTLRGNSLDNQLDGGAGDDLLLDGSELEPRSGNLWLSGADRLLGGAGNDTLRSAGGGDVLDGGLGNDELQLYPDAANTVAFGIGQGADRVVMSSGTSRVPVTLSWLPGVAEADLRLSREGVDLVVGLANAPDTLRFVDAWHAASSGGAMKYGVVATFADGRTVDLAALASSVRGTDGPDVLNGSADADRLFGLAGNDAINAGAGNDLLDGGLGNDTLAGGAGQDTLIGGPGDDIYLVDDERDQVVEVAGQGLDTVESEAIHFSLPGYGSNSPELEHLRMLEGIARSATGNEYANRITGNSAHNTLSGMAGNDTLSGLAGDDTLRGDGGDDMLEGGTGNDVYMVERASNHDTIVDAGGNADTIYLYWDTAPAQVAVRRVANNLVLSQAGGAQSVTVVNHFDPGSGGAIEEVRFSESTVWTAAVLAAKTTNRAPLLSAPLADQSGRVGGGFSLTVPANAFTDPDAGDALTYTATLANGSPLPSWLGFNAATRSFNGTPTAAGTLNLRVTATDRGGLAVSDVFDLAITAGALTLTGTADADTLSGGTGNDSLNGLGGNDRLLGGAGDDRLDGGAGNDALSGGAGNDLYLVDSSADIITEALNEGIDTVQSSASITLAANVEHLSLLGSGNLSGTGNTLDNLITGNSGANTLRGNAGNDTLDGGSGNDSMFGGAGNDSYLVNTTGDAVTELANEGIDSVTASISWTLRDQVEHLALSGSAALSGTGNGLNNRLSGNAGANTLSGLAGADTLDGGAGNDLLIGGTGGDSYIFGRGWGQDSVQENDSTAGVRDLVLLQGSLRQADLAFSRAGNHLEMAIRGTTDKLTFQNWYLGSRYQAEEFRFNDGSILTGTQAQALVGAMAGFRASSVGEGPSPVDARKGLDPIPWASQGWV